MAGEEDKKEEKRRLPYYDDTKLNRLKEFAEYISRVAQDFYGNDNAKPDHEFYNKQRNQIGLMLHPDKVAAFDPKPSPLEQTFLSNLWNMHQILLANRQPEAYAAVRNAARDNEVANDSDFNAANDFVKAFENIRSKEDQQYKILNYLTKDKLKDLKKERSSVSENSQTAPEASQPAPEVNAPPPVPPRPKTSSTPPPVPPEFKSGAVPPPLPTQADFAPKAETPPPLPKTASTPPPNPFVAEELKKVLPSQILNDKKYLADINASMVQGVASVTVTSRALADALVVELFKDMKPNVKQESKDKFVVEFSGNNFVQTMKAMPKEQVDKIAKGVEEKFVTYAFLEQDKFIKTTKTAVEKVNLSDDSKQGINNLIQLLESGMKDTKRNLEGLSLREKQVSALESRFQTALNDMAKGNANKQEAKPRAAGFSFFKEKTAPVTPAAQSTEEVKPKGPK